MGWIYAIGFLAQAFFSARILIQWILSERAHRVVSPSAYWVCSLAGSWLLFLYGWLRDDFAIILGQAISYYVYLWNLNLKGLYRKIPALLRIVLLATPVIVFAAIVRHAGAFVDAFLQNDEVPLRAAAIRVRRTGRFLAALRLSVDLFRTSRRIGPSGRILGHEPHRFGNDRLLRTGTVRSGPDSRPVGRVRGLCPQSLSRTQK